MIKSQRHQFMHIKTWIEVFSATSQVHFGKITELKILFVCHQKLMKVKDYTC